MAFIQVCTPSCCGCIVTRKTSSFFAQSDSYVSFGVNIGDWCVLGIGCFNAFGSTVPFRTMATKFSWLMWVRSATNVKSGIRALRKPPICCLWLRWTSFQCCATRTTKRIDWGRVWHAGPKFFHSCWTSYFWLLFQLMEFSKIEPLIAQMVEHETVDLVVACSSHARRTFT